MHPLEYQFWADLTVLAAEGLRPLRGLCTGFALLASVASAVALISSLAASQEGESS